MGQADRDQERLQRLSGRPLQAVNALSALPFELILKALTTGRYLNELCAEADMSSPEKLLAEVQEHSYPKLSFRQGEKNRIPTSGRVVFIANFPLGVLEIISLLDLLRKTRRDIRLWMAPELPYSDCLESFLVDEKSLGKSSSPWDDTSALLVLPANGISRLDLGNLKDGRWRSKFIDLAEKGRANIVPLYMDPRPFMRFYSWNFISAPTRKLPGFRKVFNASENQSIVRVGESITPECYAPLVLSRQAKAKLLRKQLYRVARDKPSLFRSPQLIASPQERDALQLELERSTLLGQSPDGMKIYLYEYDADSVVMPEIGRLREESFRLIGEGTGDAADLDRFDQDYWHIVLWDESSQEIAGAYRLKPTLPGSEKDLYTATLFNYLPSSEPILRHGLELGRSFVQPKYWGSRSLDYLWVGIAAFLRSHPHFRYLLGAVSISNSFSEPAQALLVSYYQRYYGSQTPIVACQRPFELDDSAKEESEKLFAGLDAKAAFIAMKQRLGQMSYGVPVLYKQYTALCEPGGVTFHGFNVDPDFNDCIDGHVVVDLEKLLPSKRKRYGLVDYQVKSAHFSS